MTLYSSAHRSAALWALMSNQMWTPHCWTWWTWDSPSSLTSKAKIERKFKLDGKKTISLEKKWNWLTHIYWMTVVSFMIRVWFILYLCSRLEEIGALASKEHSLEKSMEKMKSDWAELCFSFTAYRDTVWPQTHTHSTFIVDTPQTKMHKHFHCVFFHNITSWLFNYWNMRCWWLLLYLI